jgi:cytochrome c oxidase subunit 2
MVVDMSTITRWDHAQRLVGMNLFLCAFFFLPLLARTDAPEAWQIGFQDPATPIMQGIIDLHHDVMFFIVVVIVFVFWMITRTAYHFQASRNPLPEKIIHGTAIEIAWTVTPSLVLVLIAIPSFALLYSLDEVVDPAVTLKAIGHQWYWSYEYSDYTQSDDDSVAFDSYMIPDDDLELGQLRLLEVDNRVVLPVNTHVRVIITAADVLHSWAIPSLGVKCDAVPGRLNQIPLFLKREGVFYGQCSELCGVNHGFMPIVIEAVSLDKYVSWIATRLEEL